MTFLMPVAALNRQPARSGLVTRLVSPGLLGPTCFTTCHQSPPTVLPDPSRNTVPVLPTYEIASWRIRTVPFRRQPPLRLPAYRTANSGWPAPMPGTAAGRDAAGRRSKAVPLPGSKHTEGKLKQISRFPTRRRLSC